jgi:excisionase family DNA binding protein
MDERSALTLDEACRYLRLSRPTVRKLFVQREIPARKAGKQWRVLKTELDRYLMGEGSRRKPGG